MSTIVREGNVRIRVVRNPARRPDGTVRERFEFKWRDGAGRHRQNKSTLAAAVAAARGIAKQLQHGQGRWLSAAEDTLMAQAVLQLTDTGLTLLQAAGEVGEVQRITGGRFTAAECARFRMEHFAGAGTGRKLAEVVQEFLAAKRLEGIGRHYLKQLSGRLGRLERQLPGTLEELSPERIGRWFAELPGEPKTRKHYHDAVRCLVSWCRDKRLLPDSFKLGFKAPKVKRGRIEIFSPEEMAVLLAHAPRSLLPILALGGFAGLRTSECLKLEWRDIDFTRGHLIVPEVCASTGEATKTGRRMVPLLPAARSWLEPLAGQGRIVTLTENGFSKAMARAVVLANVALAKEGANWRVEWRHNALRHSFVSYRCAIKDNLASVSKETGHSISELQRSYLKIVPEHQAKKWFAIHREAMIKIVRETEDGPAQGELFWPGGVPLSASAGGKTNPLPAPFTVREQESA